MNIEHIAKEALLEISPATECIADAVEATGFLRRCLAKLAALDAEPVAYQHRDGMLSCRLPGGPVAGIDWTPLYTEAQLLAVQVCESIDAEYEGEDILGTWCAEAIRNGAWREFK